MKEEFGIKRGVFIVVNGPKFERIIKEVSPGVEVVD